MLSDSYDITEVEDGFFYKVEGKVRPQDYQADQRSPHRLTLSCLLQWVELKDADVDIGANPSAEEAEEGVDSSSRKVVDLIDAFNLSVRATAGMCLWLCSRE